MAECMVADCTRPATRTITVELPARVMDYYLPVSMRKHDVAICSGLHPGVADFTIKAGEYSIAEDRGEEGSFLDTKTVPAGTDRHA